MSEPEEPHIIGGPEQGCFVAALAEMSRERRSWRRRLEWVRDAVQDGAGRSPDRLASLAVFLKLVATGTVPGQEDGGHYRPNHHAQLALEIESALLPADSDPELRPLVRSILRWLPSHDGDFRRAEPLTRIRDLAHRNDIPHELKDEIKRTLQNKLHRSAGPEDLLTSARLLERISAPDSDLPADFVTQFQIFHTELQTFFNAGDVRQDLLAIGPALDAEGAELIRLFLAVHDKDLDSAERIDRELSLITRLRLHLGPAYAKVDEAHAQRMRQADLKLDERGFVLLSERANRLERSDDPPDLALLALAMAQAARQLALSGAQERPLLVMAEALENLARAFDPQDRDQLLRARARCDSLRIVLGRYADRVLASYARCARELGPKLGIARESADQFAEAEVRASLAFQLSRLVEKALGFTAAALGLSPWQVIVPGTAEGRLQTGQRIEQLDLAAPTLALLDALDGDEEIPSAVRGVFALHELPFLSHVAIRARAGGVVLATAHDRAARADFEKHLGSQVRVIAGADRLRLEAATGQGLAAPRSAAQAVPVTLSEPAVHDISVANMETAGAKATGARRLCELSDRLGFKAPRARYVPFGAMEACLELAGHGRDAVEKWQRGEGDERAVREQIMDLALPDGFEGQLVAAYADERSLAVRSSSNAEDLSGASGAGLFDSVIGIAPAEVPSALRTVWASLFARRAQAARKARPQDQVWRMATLIQPVVPADLAFIMYTRSPFDAREIYVELAAGLGETLASAVSEGSPFRVHVERGGSQVRLTAYSSYIEAKVMEDSGRVVQTLVNPAQVRFGEDRAWREAVMMRLRDLALALEGELGGAQDVEGALRGDDVWLVQSRPAQ
jgi:phosphoglucan, water dikinase